MSKTYTEPAREIEVFAEADVLVCGGGPGGVGAALAAARGGARTVLIENQICLGGAGTSGMVNRLGPYHDQKQIIIGGIPWEVLQRLVQRGLAEAPTICTPKSTDIPAGTCSRYWLVFDPEGMKKVLDELVQEAGIEVLFDTRAVAPIMDEQTISGVIVESKSGRQAILAKRVIDATGDADIAARAGVPFDLGRDADGMMQPFTLFFKCLNMDWPRAFTYSNENPQKLRERARKEVGNNFVLAGTDSYLHPEETYFNCLHEHALNGAEVRDISRAAFALRRKMWGNTEVLRRHVPGCEDVSLSASASMMGVRESRRIQGEYTLTVDDILDARQFEDQVYRYACYVDIHEPAPGRKSEYNDRCLEPGQSCGVPYRCLVPRKIENLLIAGRSLSATHEALASVRMMPSCMAMGQAVGTAAVLSIEMKTAPRQIDTRKLRADLQEQGVML